MTDTQFVRLDPRKIKIGANVRTDLHADAREFARSIK
jgi:ParB family chromosome partitioning protein